MFSHNFLNCGFLIQIFTLIVSVLSISLSCPQFYPFETIHQQQQKQQQSSLLQLADFYDLSEYGYYLPHSSSVEESSPSPPALFQLPQPRLLDWNIELGFKSPITPIMASANPWPGGWKKGDNEDDDEEEEDDEDDGDEKGEEVEDKYDHQGQGRAGQGFSTEHENVDNELEDYDTSEEQDSKEGQLKAEYSALADYDVSTDIIDYPKTPHGPDERLLLLQKKKVLIGGKLYLIKKLKQKKKKKILIKKTKLKKLKRKKLKKKLKKKKIVSKLKNKKKIPKLETKLKKKKPPGIPAGGNRKKKPFSKAKGPRPSNNTEDEVQDIEDNLEAKATKAQKKAAKGKAKGWIKYQPRPVNLGIKSELYNRFNKVTKNAEQILTAFDSRSDLGNRLEIIGDRSAEDLKLISSWNPGKWQRHYLPANKLTFDLSTAPYYQYSDRYGSSVVGDIYSISNPQFNRRPLIYIR